MPTQNPRVNVTFEPSTAKILLSLAKQEHKSISSITKELVLEALDRREDRALAVLAESRDIESAKKIQHEDAWK